MKNTNPNSKLLMSIICIVLIVNGVYQIYSGVSAFAMYIKHNIYMDNYVVAIIFDFFIGLVFILLATTGLIFLGKPNKGKICIGASFVVMMVVILEPIIRFIADLFNYHNYGWESILGNLVNNAFYAIVELSVPIIFLVAFYMNYKQWKRNNPIPAPVQYSANASYQPQQAQQPAYNAQQVQPPAYNAQEVPAQHPVGETVQEVQSEDLQTSQVDDASSQDTPSEDAQK